MLKRLVILADFLDKKGFYKEANQLDSIIAQQEIEERRRFQEEEGQDTGLMTESDPSRYDVGRTLEPGKDPKGYNDPRIIEESNGVLKCKDCGSIIPNEEKQLGCRVCEEEKNLGFLRSPDGTIHPPRLKNPPRIYDRYRQELPEDVEMQTRYKEKQ
jgi:hypothetical protein